MEKLTLVKALAIFNEIHGDRYEYNKFEYINSKHKSYITCRVHGDFLMSYSKHRMGQGCTVCNNAKGKAHFIKKFNTIHNNKYDYSLNKDIRHTEPLIVICPKHGEFTTTVKTHNSSGCSFCSNNKKKHIDDVLWEFKKKWGDRWCYDKFEYKGSSEKSIFICKEHGEFKHTPYKHKIGLIGCNSCSLTKLDVDDYIKSFKSTHRDKYNYSKVEMRTVRDDIIIICPVHGEFTQKAYYHKNGSGCSECNMYRSSGEDEVANILDDREIGYKRQKIFEDCLSDKGRKLLFDYFIEEHNLIIEYDGVQHFKEIPFWGGKEGLIKRRKYDSIKNEFCREKTYKCFV